LRNALGRTSAWRDGDTVRMAPADIPGPLNGRPWAVLRGGVAVFDSVYPAVRGGMTTAPVETAVSDLRFSLGGLPTLILRRRNRVDSLAIVETTLNGHRSSEATPVVRVQPGASIAGMVRVRYTTRGRDVLYVLAQATSWGRGQRDTLTVRSILAGVTGASFAFPVNLTAPKEPGDYWILWTQGTEPSATRLLSGTNWKCQAGMWGDGNDLPLMPDSILIEAVAHSEVLVSYLLCDGAKSRTPRRLPVAGVRVLVR
jgi:hypothetical protein